MTWQHIKAVWSSSQSKGAARLVMLCIADHANENNLAWPGTGLIAQETQVSERQVQRAIDWLVAAGELAIMEAGNGRGNSTVYRFLLSLKGDKVSPNNQPIKGDISSIKGDTLSERVTFATEKGDTMSPEVIREIPEERPKKEEGGKEQPPAVLPNPFPFKPSPVKSAVRPPGEERIDALLAICGLNRNVPDHLAEAELAATKLSDYTAAYLLRRYAFQENPNGTWYYYRDDWRGQRGDMPTLKVVIETVAKEKKPASNGRSGGNHATRQGNSRKDYPEFQPVSEDDIEWFKSVTTTDQPDTA